VVHHTERSPITFSVAAGYNSVAHFMDRIGHRRLQIIGFFGMGAGIGLIGVIPGLTAMIVPFLALSGIGFFFLPLLPYSALPPRSRWPRSAVR
jgi:PHS family inorganic phosphate transporter-like MFS transporter